MPSASTRSAALNVALLDRVTQNQYQATVNQHDMEGNFRALASRSRPGGRSLADLGYTDAVRMHAAPSCFRPCACRSSCFRSLCASVRHQRCAPLPRVTPS